ncbi:hypothetical protein B0A50_08476 [Salinomyces thailandicus]|uniref:Ketoreductase domain-containing protein n=1 Tax=Salinomyces thailandicus TaxID=706561 RepID=A0A4U0TJS2_9PEZI|nr:hypothetical protein B0A50_08476 [Salinomyces thailandica]
MSSETFSLTPSTANPPQNSTILITGGASGIGLATAAYLHTPEYNNNIVVLDRAPNPPPIPDLTNSPRFLYLQCDITNWTSHLTAFSRAANHFHHLDHIFLNAGIAEQGEQLFTDHIDPTTKTLSEPNRSTLDIDLRALGDSLKLAIHHLRNDSHTHPSSSPGSGEGAGQGGTIVLTASLAGYLASAGAPLYSAAKHGVLGYLRALKSDCKKLGIALSAVAPGITLTSIVLGVKPGQTLQEWGEEMKARGVPVNEAEVVAWTVAYAMGLGLKGSGAGFLIQGGRVQEVEGLLARTRGQWMGEEMLRLFRGGRDAPLFPNKL